MMAALPIFAGALRGIRWMPASGGKILRVFLGTYEPEQTGLFKRLIRPGDTVFDVGAHVGYYTMLAWRLAGEQGRVFAFEPDKRNLFYLKGHIGANQAKGVTVVESAVGDREGTAYFEKGTGTGTGHLAQAGTVAVPVMRLDDFVSKSGAIPRFVKIDTEGAEVMVLQGGRGVIERSRPVIFLSTHGPELHRRSLEFLAAFGYSFRPITGNSLENATEVLCLPNGGAQK